jgi:phospholipid/cholesterol/gamma-HCH transport system substrate-binding protein
MTNFRAGLLAIVVLALGAYLGFTKTNPFANPFEFEAVFNDVNNLKPKSPVRIAGVEVGRVKAVEPVDGEQSRGAARVTIEMDDAGLPLKRDAQLKIRPRIFLEGNFFIDLEPGTPAAEELDEGGTIPVTQTAAPVQIGDVLTALQRDTRADLQAFLREYSEALAGGGAEGFNESIRWWEPAYRNGALGNDATLGEDRDRDLQRVLSGQQQTAQALTRDERALKDLITSFNVTAGALAREDVALAASVPALRDTLRAGYPALGALNVALPTLRAFARDALPGVRSSDETLAAALPLMRQARLLMSDRELRGTARVLRRTIPAVVAFNRGSIPLLRETRALSACTNDVLVPFMQLEIPNPDEPENDGQQVRYQFQRAFPGLAGESRLSDGNNQFFHAGATPPASNVRPGPPPDGGSQPFPHRPDVPCETQELPDMHAPGGPIAKFQPLTRTAGSEIDPGAPPVSKGAFAAAARRFAKDGWPAIERARAEYRRRERRAAHRREGGR